MFRQVILPPEIQGQLYLHSMPGRHEQMASFISEAQRVNLDKVICLTTEDEIRHKSPEYFELRSQQQIPFGTRDFPIEDYSVPRNEDQAVFKKFVMELAEELRAGKALLIHCKMGIGRTGTVAACVLVELGLEACEAIGVVKSAGSYPMVQEQNDLVDWFSSTTQK